METIPWKDVDPIVVSEEEYLEIFGSSSDEVIIDLGPVGHLEGPDENTLFSCFGIYKGSCGKILCIL